MIIRPLELVSVQQAETAFRAALAYAEAPPYSEYGAEDENGHLINANMAAARSGLRCFGWQLALTGDAAYLPLLEAAVERMADWEDEEDSVAHALAEALGHLVGEQPCASRGLERLAAHEQALVRRAVARGLSVEQEGAVAVLEVLAGDVDPLVREAAKTSLGPGHEIPWWRGIFDSDPMARLSAADAQRLAPVFGKLRTVLGSGLFTKDALKVGQLVKQLPDVLAFEVAERFLVAQVGHTQSHQGVLEDLLQRQGAAESLVRVVSKASSLSAKHLLEHAVLVSAPRVRREDRVALALTLARAVVAASAADRKDYDGPTYTLGHMTRDLWPEEADPSALLELVLGSDAVEDGEDAIWEHALRSIVEAGRKTTVGREAWLERMVEARLQGYPGRWRVLGVLADEWLEHAPVDMLRKAAARGLESPLDAPVEWAASLMVGKAHNPKLDGPVLRVMEGLLRNPRTRAVILEHHELRLRAVSCTRADVRAGTADLRTAAAALRAIHWFWGGLGDNWADAEEGEQERRKRRREFAAFLGPKALRGPITPEEWNVLRQRRNGMSLDGKRLDWTFIVTLLPRGPWHPDDRTLLERVMEVASTRDSAVSMDAALMLSAAQQASDEPVWQQLLHMGDPEDRDWVRSRYQKVRVAMGLPAVERKRGGVSHTDPQDWVDAED